jgi:transcriptional regulator with XRE-family HTH domain
MENINELVGSNLKKVRRDNGWSQDYVARELGMSQNNYSRIENGKSQITLSQLKDISKVMAVDLKELITLN